MKQKEIGYNIMFILGCENGFDVLVTELDTCIEEAWEEFEMHYIRQYRAYGYKLTNISDGGVLKISDVEKLKNIHIKNGLSHKKALIALTRDGTFYKEFNSAKDAAIELGVDITAIAAASNGRTKTSCGFIFIKKSEYDPSRDYTFLYEKERYIYRFDMNGNLIGKVKSLKHVVRSIGGTERGVKHALERKKLLRNSYWSLVDHIDITEFNNGEHYSVTKDGKLYGRFFNQKELGKFFNRSEDWVRKKSLKYLI